MIERKQKIHKTATRKVATNWTLSGTPIEQGIYVQGATRNCPSCGTELMPYQDSCSRCK